MPEAAVVVVQETLVMRQAEVVAEALEVKDLIIRVVLHLHLVFLVQVTVKMDRQTQAAEAAVVLEQTVALLLKKVMVDQE